MGTSTCRLGDAGGGREWAGPGEHRARRLPHWQLSSPPRHPRLLLPAPPVRPFLAPSSCNRASPRLAPPYCPPTQEYKAGKDMVIVEGTTVSHLMNNQGEPIA